MASPIAERRPSELELLLRAARRMRAGRRHGPGRALPLLLFVTDPDRTPEPWRIAERLPRGSGVVFRSFGRANAAAVGRRLKAVAARRGLLLLVGADPALARTIGADGVHLPERLAHRAQPLRLAHPHWIVTAAAHSHTAVLKGARAGAQALLVSPVFESASPSAGRPLTPLRFAGLVRAAGAPVYALGGVDRRTAARLALTGAAGIAAVEALART